MAGVDEDFAFGDFTFASFPSSSPNLIVHSIPDEINGSSLPPVANNQAFVGDDEDDDDWGDFVKSPLAPSNDDQNQLPSAPAHTQSKPLDPFSFSSENVSGSSTGPKASWEKVNGPLPLSLFGETEDEEEVKGSSANDVQKASGKDSVAKAVGSNASPPSKSGLNDIIANLYCYDYPSTSTSTAYDNNCNSNANKEMTGEKGSNLILEMNGFNLSSGLGDVKKSSDIEDQKVENSNGISVSVNSSRSDTDGNAVRGFDFSGWGDEFKGLGSNSNMYDQSKQGKVESNGFSFSSNGLVTNVNTSTSNVSASSWDLGGWGFIDNGLSANSGMLNCFDSLNGSTASKGASLNGKNGELDGYGNDGDADEDDGWEFKGAFSEQKATHGFDEVGLKTSEPSNITTHSSGSGSGSNKPVNLFAFSDGLNDFLPTSSGVSTFPSKVGQDLNVMLSIAAPVNSSPDVLFKSEPREFKFQMESDIAVGDDESDEDFGEFTAAFPETGTKKETDSEANDISTSGIEATTTSVRMDQVKVERQLDESSQLDAYTSSPGNGSSSAANLFSMSNRSVDLFPMSDVINGALIESHTDINAVPSKSAEIVVTFPTHVFNAQGSSLNGSNPHSVLDKGVDNDDFDDFAASFPEAGRVKERKLEACDHAQSELQESACLEKDVENKNFNGNNKGALPMSIFGDEELDVDPDIQNAFIPSHSTVQMKGQNPKSLVSIDDLISTLYSQAGQNAPVYDINGSTGIGLSPTTGYYPEPPHNADDFDEEYWEFKDSFAKEDPDNKSSFVSTEVGTNISPSKGRLNNFVDFYSKLKDRLHLVTKFHLETLKKADDNGKVMALNEEIQNEFKDFDQEAAINQEDSLEGLATGDGSLHEFLEALKDPILEILESQYGLSNRLSLAEKDLRSAVELRKHAETIFKVLCIGSVEDHLIYVTIWSKLMFVCAYELQCGAKVWKQSLERNVKNELLTETEGKRLVKALGEIYRVAMVLGLSVRLYRPWTFECSAESSQIYDLLEECHNLWSSSGLGEALLDMLHLDSFESDDGLATLVESIQYINNLDVLPLQDQVFSQDDARCRLSLLSSETIPGFKVVNWDGEQYFVKLANLWANLISCDPPRVPRLRVVDEKAS